ncbi:unnamed protein product, partial [Ixodes pacificus]
TNTSSSSSVHEAASDCICNALLLIGETSKPAPLAQVLVLGVYSLENAYHMSVAQEDQDRSVNYCRIFTELAESLLEEIIRHPGQGLGDFRTLDLLLTCVGHYDYEVAEITFNLWYRMSEVLYKENNEALNGLFERYIQLLIVALCRHCQLDPDKEGVPSDQDDFGDFRNRVSDLIKDVVFLVGSSNCFRQASGTLLALQFMFSNLKGPSCTWEVTEATLFAMAAIAKNILPEENAMVPEVVEAILKLPPESHLAVRHTSIQLLGELCEWIEKHPSYLISLDALLDADLVLSFLLQALQERRLASVAASSLLHICSTCRSQMVDHFGALLQVVAATDSLCVSTEAAVGLLKVVLEVFLEIVLKVVLGVALEVVLEDVLEIVLNVVLEVCRMLHVSEWGQTLAGTVLVLTQMSPDKITGGLRELCRIQLDPLTQVRANKGACRRHLLATGHTDYTTNKRVWPVLSRACHRYQGDTRVMERCCRCIRFAVRCVGRQSHALLQPLVTQMVQLYQVHQHSCFLYLGSILVDEYGSEQGCVQGLLEMLQAFCGPTFRLLGGADALRQHPDTVDDLFRLCTRFLQRAPLVFLKSTVLTGVLQCSLAACTLDHKEANASVMKFLFDLVHSGRSKQDASDFAERRSIVGTLLASQGQALVTTLIQSAIFCLPTSLLPDVAETLYEMLQFDRQVGLGIS